MASPRGASPDQRPRPRARSGVLLSESITGLEELPLGWLRDQGLDFVVIACPEDEARWEAERLAAFTREVTRHGLEGYIAPWGYGKVLEGDAAAGSLYLHTQPHTLQVDSRGRRCPRACPNDPRYLEWFANSMRTLAWLLESRGFVWDTPGFHQGRGAWSCRCGYCQRLFNASAGRALPRALSPEVLEFRRRSLSLFLLAATAAIQSVDRRLESVVVPPPPLAQATGASGADDWRLLAANSGATALGLALGAAEKGPALPPPQTVAEPVAAAHSEGKPVWLWLDVGRLTPEVVEDARLLTRELAAEAVVWSDYEALRRAWRG